MRAIILAAGRGSRMGVLTDDQPKCRTELHGKSLIEWQLSSLQGAGIADISLVRGYLAETFDFPLHYFDNQRWSETNMVESLVAASPWLEKYPCIISYSDIVFSKETVSQLQNTTDDIVLSYDPNWQTLWEMRFEDPLSDAETFRINENGQILEIGNKTSDIKDIQGQYMGLLKITPQGWKQVQSFLNTLAQEQRDKLDMTSLLQHLIKQQVSLKGIPIKDKWYEVDSESDLKQYQKLPQLFSS